MQNTLLTPPRKEHRLPSRKGTDNVSQGRLSSAPRYGSRVNGVGAEIQAGLLELAAYILPTDPPNIHFFLGCSTETRPTINLASLWVGRWTLNCLEQCKFKKQVQGGQGQVTRIRGY